MESGDDKPKKAEVKKDNRVKKEEKPVVLKKVAGKKKEEEQEPAPAPAAKAAPRVQPAHERPAHDRAGAVRSPALSGKPERQETARTGTHDREQEPAGIEPGTNSARTAET